MEARIDITEMKCKKCNESSTLVTLRKNDLYCIECFLATVNHKFRSTIGKNKIIGKNENVLICISGKAGSTVLLDLVNNALLLDNHKKLRINPTFLHLVDDYEIAKKVIKLCQSYNYDVYLPHISVYMISKSDLPTKNSLPITINEIINEFNEMQNRMLPTARDDSISQIKRTLFIRYAKILNCKYIFTGETTTTLATKLLTNLAIGRGSQVQNDVGFLDNRDQKTKIIRPIKDITEEELRHYIKIKNLEVNMEQENMYSSLHIAINDFVTDLQENFQSTISTICKTAEKIGMHECGINLDKKICIICQSVLQSKDIEISALDATSFSKIVSLSTQANSTLEDVIEENIVSPALFPFIHTRLCYACSKNYAENKQNKIPQYIVEALKDEV